MQGIVAAFTGGVDGNIIFGKDERIIKVAAFTGGVDGNIRKFWDEIVESVAAFTGGVDGNTCFGSTLRKAL